MKYGDVRDKMISQREVLTRDGICNYVGFTGYMRDTDVKRRAGASVNGGN